MATIPEALALALQHHQSGRLQAAEQIYRQILALQPHHADALHLLGVISAQVGRPEIAIELIGQAIALSPDRPAFFTSLGEAHRGAGQLDQAIAAHRQATVLQPNYLEAHYNLGVALNAQEQWEAASAAFRQAIVLKPNYPNAHCKLGLALKGQGRLDEAIVAYRQAIALQPNYPEAHNNLGNALRDKGELNEALVACRKALALQPNYVESHYNLGNILREKEQMDEAIAAYQQALALQPNHLESHNNLGNALKEQGRLEEAVASFRRALELQPLSFVHSNLLCCQIYDSQRPLEKLLQDHLHWAELYAPPEFLSRPQRNDPDPRRRLRIGYVSADFREHAVARFVEPILRCCDHQQFELFCYAENKCRDATTRRFQTYADQWRWTFGLHDAAFDELIQADRIDILIDLSGHTAGNRLPALARKPAPVQVTYIGYPATTGLRAMDYRFTDAVLNPHDEPTHHVEQLYRLPCGSGCFEPRTDCPEVVELPALESGHLTFGAPHNLGKLNDGVLDLWSRLLRDLPRSRLILFRGELSGSAAQRIRKSLLERAVRAEQFELLSLSNQTHGYQGYMAKYGEIDICLDTFPTNAGTTACEALWMGVPWLTLSGDRFFGRQTASLLTRLGLSDWVARSPGELLDKALDWSARLCELAEIRTGLRRRFMDSTVGNAVQYTRGLEAAYRDIWERWCRQQKGT